MSLAEKPKNFWQNPTGRIISHVVHDANNATCSAGASISLLKSHIKEGNFSENYMLERLTRIEDALKRIEKAVDYGYTKLKEKEGY